MTSVRLKDFGIEVKSAHVLLVSIDAGNVALVRFDVRLSRVR